jgi:tRNA (guanine10-N2)-dimethyltransferase
VYVLELGGQDDAFAAREAESAASAVEVIGPGLATARGISDRVRYLAFTRRASALLGRCDPTVDAARALLSTATVERSGSVAVRAIDVRGTTGVDTQRAERELGSVLVERGFAVDLDDPDHELRALFTEGTCALGWLAVETVRDFGARAPTDRPFFQPGSMDPIEARAVVNLAGVRPGQRVLDPMCGTGGLLIEAGLLGATVLGSDAQRRMVAGTRENLAAALADASDGDPANAAAPRYPDPGDAHVVRADATALPLGDGAIDAAVFDVPYGRQSHIAGDLDTLVAGALAEAARVAARAVVVADRSWAKTARAAGWTVADVFERRVHRSLVRFVHVLR